MNPIQTIRYAINTYCPEALDALTALAELERTHYTAEDVADASAQGFRDGVASVASVTAGQEPVAWQRRMRPTWGSDTAYPWSPWEQCTKGQADDHWKTPLLHEWAYEARALYTAAPVAQQPLITIEDSLRFRLDCTKERLEAAERECSELRAKLKAQQPNEWKEAVLDWLAHTGKDFPTDTPPREIVKWLMNFEHEVAQQPQAEDYKGWYCAHCQRGVDGSEVTFHEQHTVCGRVITDDLPPKQPQAEAVPPDVVRDAERLVWAMHNMSNPFGRHEFGFTQHIMERGGTGDVEDCRSYIDAAIAAQGAKS